MKQKCPICGPSDTEYDNALGHVVCVSCGQVLEQNAMVSELTFTESAGGAVLADGFTLKAGQARAKPKTPFVGAPGLRMHQDSSEQTRERGHAVFSCDFVDSWLMQCRLHYPQIFEQFSAYILIRLITF